MVKGTEGEMRREMRRGAQIELQSLDEREDVYISRAQRLELNR